MNGAHPQFYKERDEQHLIIEVGKMKEHDFLCFWWVLWFRDHSPIDLGDSRKKTRRDGHVAVGTTF
jgi:hypothetical protein